MLQVPVHFFARIAGSIGIAAMGHAAGADGLSIGTSGAVDIHATSARVRDSTVLVPSPEESGYKESYYGVEALLGVTARTEALTFGSQLRLVLDDENGEAHVDEAYAETPVGGHAFAFAGRRILAWGQSIGLNPADLFRDPTRENDVLRQSEARARAEGADMVGADIAFDGGALTVLLAPGFDRRGNGREEDLALLRLSGFVFDSSLDYAVSAIGGDRPGAGLSLNYAAGDATVVYFDGTFRQGREKRTIIGLSRDDGSLVLNPETDDIHPFGTLGFGHTFRNGLSMNFEYTKDMGGYSENEAEDIASALDKATPAETPLQMRGLGELNRLLDHHTLLRNYAFARIAHDGPFGGKTSVEMTTLLGLDDASGIAGLRFERPLGERSALGLRIDRGYGKTNTEFTLRPETDSLSIYAGMKF